MKRHKSAGSDQIPAELIEARSEMLCSKIHKLINSIWNKEYLPDQWRSLLLYQYTRRVRDMTAVIIMGYDCY
jgi:hypothetical protein